MFAPTMMKIMAKGILILLLLIYNDDDDGNGIRDDGDEVHIFPASDRDIISLKEKMKRQAGPSLDFTFP